MNQEIAQKSFMFCWCIFVVFLMPMLRMLRRSNARIALIRLNTTRTGAVRGAKIRATLFSIIYGAGLVLLIIGCLLGLKYVYAMIQSQGFNFYKSLIKPELFAVIWLVSSLGEMEHRILVPVKANTYKFGIILFPFFGGIYTILCGLISIAIVTCQEFPSTLYFSCSSIMIFLIRYKFFRKGI